MGGHDCPTCGKALSTKRGMQQHHTKVHGESLPNRECADCGEMFYDEKAQRTYCEDCYSAAGEKNGNRRDEKEETECQSRGSTFEYYPSNKDGVLSPACVEANDGFLGTPSYELRDVERVEFVCEQCPESFTLLASRLRPDQRNGRFCSHQCESEWMSENWRGENHHQWVDGKPEYNGSWWAIRRSALERDDYMCQHCGATVDDLGRNPDVHHIQPVREFEDPGEAHFLDNVVSLCRSCHRNVEAGNLPAPQVE